MAVTSTANTNLPISDRPEFDEQKYKSIWWDALQVRNALRYLQYQIDVTANSFTPAGATTQVQYNAAGAFGASANFTYNPTTFTLTVNKIVAANFTSTAQGLTPASGGGSSNFLRADGTWTAPTGTPGGSTTQIQYNNAGAFAGSANLTWNSSSQYLGIGTSSPSANLSIYQGTAGKGLQLFGNSLGGTSSGTGFLVTLGYNTSGNKQMWLGDFDGAGNSSYSFVRFTVIGGTPGLDAVAGDNASRRPIYLGTPNDPDSGVLCAATRIFDGLNVGFTSNNPMTAGRLQVEEKLSVGALSPTSTLHVTGSQAASIVKKTGAYTLTVSEHTVLGDATSGAFALTLPAASTCVGRKYVCKKIDASGNAVMVTGNGAETIDGSNTQALSVRWASILIQSDGTGWYILSKL